MVPCWAGMCFVLLTVSDISVTLGPIPPSPAYELGRKLPLEGSTITHRDSGTWLLILYSLWLNPSDATLLVLWDCICD